MIASLLDPKLPYSWVAEYILGGLLLLGIVLVPFAWLYSHREQRRS